MGSLDEEDLEGGAGILAEASAEEAMLEDWMDEDLREALAALPEHYRRAVLLRDVAQWSYAQVAEQLDLPQGTVMSRLHRGRTLLRKDLDQRWAQVPAQLEGGYARRGVAKAA